MIDRRNWAETFKKSFSTFPGLDNSDMKEKGADNLNVTLCASKDIC